MSTVDTALPLIREKLQSRVNSEWFLDNPHLWADQVVGTDLYERHILEGGTWLGWQDNQVAFLRDVTDFDVRKLYAICNRGGAKTWLTAIGTCCLLHNLPKLKVSILSGSFEQASICYDYMSDIFQESAMKAIIKGDVTMKRTRTKYGGIVRVLPASTKRTKAPRSDIVIVDEACETDSYILQSAFPQVITATKFKIIILTTPDDLNHIVHDWWLDAEKLGFVRYHWSAYQCRWIPEANIQEFRNLYDESTFRIMVLGEWSSKEGNPFKYGDVQAALCDIPDLPPVNRIDRFCLGIDWGDAHQTVATVLGLKGDVKTGTDEWFVYDQLEFSREDMDVILFGGINSKGEESRGIMDLIDLYNPVVWSEHSPVSAFMNRKLRAECIKRGIVLRTGSYSGKKKFMVKNLVGSFEKRKIKIPRRFRKLIEQVIAYHYKEVSGRLTEEFEKVNDDHVDSLVWARWLVHPAQAGPVTVGELADSDL